MFDDFHLAGVVAISPLYADTDQQPLWLWGLHVQAKFRGTPASRLLMPAIQDWAEMQHPGGTTLAAYRRDNRGAQQLLDRFGFIGSDLGPTLLRSGVAGNEDVIVEYSNKATAPRHDGLSTAAGREALTAAPSWQADGSTPLATYLTACN